MALIVAILCFAGNNASAIGIGAYGQYKSASTIMWVDYTDPININGDWEETPKSKRSLSGFGLLLDTAVSTDSIFNYRLQIGMGSVTLSVNGVNYNEDISLKEYHMYHSFGFGILRNDLVRLWLGPQVGLGTASGKFSYPGQSDTEFEEYFASIGGVFGLNIHVSTNISLGLCAGVRKNLIAGGLSDV
jgi:hypothetical protein